MPTKFDRITTNPEEMNGQPCVRGILVPYSRFDTESMQRYRAALGKTQKLLEKIRTNS